MKKYRKPMLDIIEFDNMDVIVMSGETTTSDEPDDGGAGDIILVEQPINSDSTNVSEGHEESVPETEETSVPDESVS